MKMEHVPSQLVRDKAASLRPEALIEWLSTAEVVRPPPLNERFLSHCKSPILNYTALSHDLAKSIYKRKEKPVIEITGTTFS